MIQNKQNGDWLGFQARYNNQKNAEDGHWLAYDKLEDMILEPEKYPMGIIEMFSNAMEAATSEKKLYSQDTKQRST